MKWTSIVIIALLCACGNPDTSWRKACPNPLTEPHRAWVDECSFSRDEVGCTREAAEMFCSRAWHFWSWIELGWVPCTEAKDAAARRVCEQPGDDS